MIDLSDTVIAKSDQLNAIDLIGGPETVTITKVSKAAGDQPVTINYEGDDGRPFKPCKTMRRLLIGMWGADGSKYVGRKLTLYLDPDVKWAGKKEGGVRISHASDISGEKTFVLRETRNSTTHYKVKPLGVTKEKVEEKGVDNTDTPSFDIDGFDTLVTIALTTACDADETELWWEDLKPKRLEARATDKERAGKIATRVAEKIAALKAGEGDC